MRWRPPAPAFTITWGRVPRIRTHLTNQDASSAECRPHFVRGVLVLGRMFGADNHEHIDRRRRRLKPKTELLAHRRADFRNIWICVGWCTATEARHRRSVCGVGRPFEIEI